MKIAENTFVSLDYKLEVDGAIADQSRPDAPLEFPFGAGYLLPKFEQNIAGLKAGDTFAFTLSPEDGYGEIVKEAVIELPKDIFMINGTIEDDLLVVGNQIPMSDASGNRMLGTVKAVSESGVTMDFNHPMAGKTLNFSGKIVGVRQVRPEDLQPAGCSGGCGEGCGEHGCSDHGCDCGCH